MEIFKRIAENSLKTKRKRIINFLCNAHPEDLIRASEQGVISAFKRTAQRVPAYKELLHSLNIEPSGITDIESFKKLIPYLDKKNAFQDNSIQNLCLDGNLKEVKSILTSSGHSGIFSFGVNTLQNLKDSSQSIDLGLDYSFDISNKKTLLINCLPMGVKVNTSLTIAETSVREDMVWAVIKKFASQFEQIILVGEGSFLKKIVEDGLLQGINWQSGVFHFVAGEEGIAENYRTYIAQLVGIDLDGNSKGMIGSSMGIAELDLNIFHETRGTIRIRRLANANTELRHALFGDSVKFCPMLFVYYPHRTYIEELAIESGKKEIVISMLSPRMKIPLMRYKTGDFGKLLPYRKVQEILMRFGYEKLMPDLKLPLIAIFGRGDAVKFKNYIVYPEEIKEAIYADFSLVSSLTGAFRLIKTDTDIILAVQLKKDAALPRAAQEKLKASLSRFTNADLRIVFYLYPEFPYAMELDYERKFKYI